MGKIIKQLPGMLVVVALCLFASFACGSSNNKNDQFLADYEKLVVKYEEAAQKSDGISQEELTALQKEAVDFATKAQTLMQDSKEFSTAQIEKMQSLAQRLMATQQNIKIKE
jgi:hypothetical protein